MSFIQRKNVIWFLIVCLVIAITSYMSLTFGAAWLFWFFGGVLLGAGVHFCFTEKPKRTAARLIIVAISTGLVSSLAALLVGMK